MSIEPFPGLAEFVFSAPLYAKFKLTAGSDDVRVLYNRLDAKIDGHCPFCHRTSTFKVYGAHIPGGDPWNSVHTRYAFDAFYVECARDEGHQLRFWFLIQSLVIQKVGQHPSLADIANDESGIYRAVLTEADAAEFHRAIGLAAHGLGIGSFVYLRRIFERLINKRFEEFKPSEDWLDDTFVRLRMDEKVAFLRDHLPQFLVEHSKIYSILSVGVHELTDDECLAFFEVLKQSIVIMLEEDKKKKKELELRMKFSKAIKSFGSEPSATAKVVDASGFPKGGEGSNDVRR
jgi:hypothetical protein